MQQPYSPPGQFAQGQNPMGYTPPPGMYPQQQGYPPQQQQGYPPQGYPPPGYGPPGYPQYQQGAYNGVPVAQPVMGPQVVIVDQPVISGFGREPTACVCPNCKAQVMTAVNAEPGAMAWLSCLCLGIVGFWPCMCIPFCVDTCLDISHICPNCNVVIRRRAAFD